MSGSQRLVLVLAIVSAIVSARQYRQYRKEASLTWALICAYWVILTVKNVVDHVSGVR